MAHFLTETSWTNPILIFLFIWVIARSQITSIIKQLSHLSHIILYILYSDPISYHLKPFYWDIVAIYLG